MAYILHQSPTGHGHGHGTAGYEQLESRGGSLPSHGPLPGSTSVRAAFIHVVGDLLQSIGVLVAATIIYFKVPGLEPPPPPRGRTPSAPRRVLWGGRWALAPPHTVPSSAPPPPAPHSPCSLQPQCKIADPISTLFFSVFVLGSTFTILKDVFRVLMEGLQRGRRVRDQGCRVLVGAQELLGAVAATAPSPRGSSPPHNLCPPPSPPLCPSLAPLSPPSPSVLSHPGKGPVVGRRLTTEPPSPGHSLGKPPPPAAPTTRPGPGGGPG